MVLTSKRRWDKLLLKMQSYCLHNQSMDRDQALDILRLNQAELARRGVRRAALFGSIARDQQRPDSDLDILVEIEPSAELDVFSYVSLTEYIGDLFAMRVDVANSDALKSHVKATAQRDAIYAF